MEFLDLKRQYRTIGKEIDEAIRRVIKGGTFIGGEEVKKFEEEVASFLNVKYAVGVNSGTDALYLALKALNMEKDAEVITTPFTFVATADTVIQAGARPVFSDTDNTFNIDPDRIEDKITAKTKAIIPVHIFGLPADSKILKIAKRNKLFVIEDAAQAIGAIQQNRHAGTLGDIGCFSFFPSKNLGAYGDGGLVVTDKKALYEKIKMLKSHGSREGQKYVHIHLGINSRLDSIQAAILRVKLKYLSEWTGKRQEIAALYSKSFAGIDEIVVPQTNQGVFHQYTIRAEKRDKLKNFLSQERIPTMIYYPRPLHLQPALSYLGYGKGSFPEAEKSSREVLSLPIYPELRLSEQKFVINKVRSFYTKS